MGYIHGWNLPNAKSSDSSKAGSDISKVIFSNASDSDFSVDFYLRGGQLGSYGPGTSSDELDCEPGDEVGVKASDTSSTGKAFGVYEFK